MLSVGFQLAAAADGTWTAVFRGSCMQGACNVFARRFDAPAAHLKWDRNVIGKELRDATKLESWTNG